MVELRNIYTQIKDGDWIESKDQSIEGIRLVQTGNIGVGTYLDKENRAKFISEQTFDELKCTEIFEGDILISRLPSPVGRACLVPKLDDRAITAVDCTILRVNEDICIPKYFVYYTMSNMYLHQIDRFVVGTTRARISRKNLEGIKIFLPRIEVQHKIVEALDKAQELIDKRKEQIEALDELVKSKFIEMFGDPVKNTKQWKQLLCKEITSKIGSGATPKGGNSSYKDEGISLIRSMNVHNNKFIDKDLAFIDDEQADKLKNVIIEKNDVLLNITGASVARCCIVPSKYIPARVNQHVAILRCKNDEILHTFLCYLLTSESYQRLLWDIATSGGATREAITKQQIESLEFIVPPIELQNQFEMFIKQVDKLKFEMETSLKELEDNFNSLMQKAFKGELFQ
ncbi:MAG: restriction endonuclease subunit S [Paraclostridium sp.]